MLRLVKKKCGPDVAARLPECFMLSVQRCSDRNTSNLDAEAQKVSSHLHNFVKIALRYEMFSKVMNILMLASVLITSREHFDLERGEKKGQR